MLKLFIFVGILLFGGCSYFTFNAAMCDQIASDPQATVPQECRNYNEAQAQKAFDKTKDTKESIDADIIKVQKQSN